MSLICSVWLKPCRYYVGGFRVESVSGQLWNAVKDTFSKSITLLRDRWNLFNENVSLVKRIWIVLSWTHLFECRFTMYFILTFEVSSKKTIQMFYFVAFTSWTLFIKCVSTTCVNVGKRVGMEAAWHAAQLLVQVEKKEEENK